MMMMMLTMVMQLLVMLDDGGVFPGPASAGGAAGDPLPRRPADQPPSSGQPSSRDASCLCLQGHHGKEEAEKQC